MKKFIIGEDIVNSILNYLQERPYKEVANGIVMLSNLEVYEEPEEPKEELKKELKKKN